MARLLPWVACAVVSCSAAASAQAALRTWGSVAFDGAAHTGAVDLALGEDVAHTVHADGRISAFGSNHNLQLNVPALPAGQRYLQVSANFLWSGALRSDGSVVLWGANGRPTVPPPPYVDVRVGGNHVLLLRPNGQLVAIGDNSVGQCNVPPLPPGVVYVDARPSAFEIGGIGVVAGSVALRSDGQIVAFGWYGGPPALPPGTTYTGLAAGFHHFLATRSDGVLIGWGGNGFGEASPPSPPAGTSWVAAAAGEQHSVALRSDGQVACFGFNGNGRCDVPPLPPGLVYVAIAAGTRHSAAIRSDGVMLVWPPLDPGPQGLAGYRDVAVGPGRVLEVREDGSAVEWDANGVRAGVPPLPPGRTYVAAAAGDAHALLLRSDGEVVAFGDNSLGQTGVPPLPVGVTYVAIASGGALGNHSLALRSDGLVAAWGGNAAGQLNVPPLPTGQVFTAIAAGRAHSAALRSDGAVVVWGDTAQGQGAVPSLPAGVRPTAIVGGGDHTGVVRSDGDANVWGQPALTLPLLPTGQGYVGLTVAQDGALGLRSDGTLARAGTALPAPLAPAGTSYVSARATQGLRAAVLAPRSSVVRLAPGCGGTLPAAQIVPVTLPRLGAPWTVRVRQLPLDAAVLFVGGSNTASSFGPLPLDATPFGAPGCVLHCSDDLALLVVGGGSEADVTLSVPDAPPFLGLVLFEQAAVFDPGANALGVVLSDAVTAVLGG